jgi:hypothetical protein
MSGVDLLNVARTAIAASSTSTDDMLAVHYCAVARVALSQLREELQSVEAVVSARESELVRRGSPKSQLGLEERGE